MTRTLLIALIAVGTLALSACGEDEVSANGEQAAQAAKGLTEQLRDIERDVRDNVRALDDGATRAEAENALGDAAAEARAVARKARQRLPEDDAARREIEQAANRIAAAADTPEDAQATLDKARENLAQAVGSIDPELPKSARESLDELRDSLEQGS
jgi:hypothetical protein